MPIFSRFWRDQATGLANAEELRVRGPALQVEIMIPSTLAAALQDAGKPIVAPQVGLAVVDTGASVTAVDEEILKALGLTPTNVMAVATPSAASVQQPLYGCEIAFPGTPLPTLPFNEVVGCQLKGLGCIALIGRDVLRYCQLVYNGPEGFWTISF